MDLRKVPEFVLEPEVDALLKIPETDLSVDLNVDLDLSSLADIDLSLPPELDLGSLEAVEFLEGIKTESGCTRGKS